MKKFARMAFTRILGSLYLYSALTGCVTDGIGTKPKELVSTSKLKITPGNSANNTNFVFNFAFINTDDPNKILYLQGGTNSKASIISTCNSTGAGCVCEFLNSDNSINETSATGNISYDSTGNYIRCIFTTNTVAGSYPPKIRIRNIASTVYSDIYDVEKTLTRSKILGSLSGNKLRGIYRYTCMHNYWQKTGSVASTGYFDCSTQAVDCDGSGNDLCMLQINYPYFLFLDNYSTNITLKPIANYYNGAQGGTTCGAQILLDDCSYDPVNSPSTNGNSDLTLQFGLYSEKDGIFDTAVSLTPAPNYSSTFYGYAGQVSSFGGSTVCPPGLKRQIAYVSTPLQAELNDANNVASLYPAAGVSIIEVSAPASLGGTPSDPVFKKQSGAVCNGSACGWSPQTPAAIPQVGGATTFDFTASGSEFCVVPASFM